VPASQRSTTRLAAHRRRTYSHEGFTSFLQSLLAFTLLFLTLGATIPTTAAGAPAAVLSCGTFITNWGSTGTDDGQFSHARGIALDAGANVYVTDGYSPNSRVQVFDSNGNFLRSWRSGTQPLAIGLDSSGNVYVTDGADDRIRKFTNTGTSLTRWGGIGSNDGQFVLPAGIAVDSAGNVYVTDNFNDRIQKFTNTGTFLTKWGRNGTADGDFQGPYGIALDPDGNVYVSDNFNYRIQKFTSTGTFLTKWGMNGQSGEGGQFVFPAGVALDPVGNVYVTDSGKDRIQKFTSIGTFLTAWGGAAEGVAVDPVGNVYVTDGDRVQKFACPFACTTDPECDDHNLCDGIETCDLATGLCQAGVPLRCDDGLLCNGVETCDPTTGCAAGTSPTCALGDADPECNDSACVDPAGCIVSIKPDGTLCNGDRGLCTSGTCTTSTTPPCTSDGQCDDGDSCNGLETCDPITGCTAGRAVQCASNEECDSSTGNCRRVPIIVVPGIEGTELRRVDNNQLVWLSPVVAAPGPDTFFLALLLNPDGITSDSTRYCALSHSMCDNCIVGDPCVAGGVPLLPSGLLSIQIPGTPVRFYTAYDDLIAFLRDARGYQLNRDLFTYPYDWRYDIGPQGKRFGAWLRTHVPGRHVDVVAHSQGGLLLSSYLAQTTEEDVIRTVIFLGTPHQGSPQAYMALRGYNAALSDLDIRPTPLLDLSTLAFLVRNFPSAYELLPTLPFVFRGRTTAEPLDSTYGQPPLPNPMLRARATDFHSAIGSRSRAPRTFAVNGSAHRTINRLVENVAHCFRVGTEATGDGTVPTASAAGLTGVSYFYVDSQHSSLPGNLAAQEQILNIIEGHDGTLASGVSLAPLAASNGIVWSACSPIRVHITDSVGHQNGLTQDGVLHEDIPESGHAILGDNESGWLPADAAYAIDIDATAPGTFTLTFDEVAGGADSPVRQIAFTDVAISDHSHASLTLQPGATSPMLSLDVDGDGRYDGSVAPNQPANPSLCIAVLVDLIRSRPLSKRKRIILMAQAQQAAHALIKQKGRKAIAKLDRLAHLIAKRANTLPAGLAEKLAAITTTCRRLISSSASHVPTRSPVG
jgi:DNA-binding beta-propeller fold protein YncE